MASESTVYDLQNHDPEFCYDSDSVADAAEKMEENEIGALLVRNSEDKTIGIITERDFLNKILAESKSPSQIKISDIMTEPVLSIPLHASVEAAVEVMLKGQIRHLPIKNSRNEYVGIISIRDLLSGLLQEYRKAVKTAEVVKSKKHGDIVKKT
jgi:CBS domain-containing protein